MTLVPARMRDPSHGAAGRIAGRGEPDALTRPGESCIVEISGALHGPSRREPVGASRPVRGLVDAALPRPAEGPPSPGRRLPGDGLVGGVALRLPQLAQPGPLRGPGRRAGRGPPCHARLLARGVAARPT